MKRKLKIVGTVLFALITILVLAWPSIKNVIMPQPLGGPVGVLSDGVYEGYYNSPYTPNDATVKVTVTGGKLAGIKIVDHFASSHGKRAEGEIPDRMIHAQSTKVDIVSGATSSSVTLMNAVYRALEKAR